MTRWRLYNNSPTQSIVGDYESFAKAAKVIEEKNLTEATIVKIQLDNKKG